MKPCTCKLFGEKKNRIIEYTFCHTKIECIDKIRKVKNFQVYRLPSDFLRAKNQSTKNRMKNKFLFLTKILILAIFKDLFLHTYATLVISIGIIAEITLKTLLFIFLDFLEHLLSSLSWFLY